jgi:hypothetical protein
MREKATMGRPPLPEDQRRKVIFRLCCTEAEKQHILSRGGSNYVRAVLAAAAQRGKP